MCILLPSRPPFMLDVFLAVGQTSSLMPRAGQQAALASCSRSPEQLGPPAVACVGHPWAGAALGGRRSSELALVPAGVSGLAEAGGAGLPLPGSLGHGDVCSPTAEEASSRF